MKVKGLPEKFVSVYNEFVDTCNENNLTFESFSVDVGESKKGQEGLIFEMNFPNGLEQEKANQIFKTFIENHPNSYLTFNQPEHSELEKMLRSASQTVIAIEKGYRLERI